LSKQKAGIVFIFQGVGGAVYSNTGQEVLFKSAFDAPPRAARCLIFIMMASQIHIITYICAHDWITLLLPIYGDWGASLV